MTGIDAGTPDGADFLNRTRTFYDTVVTDYAEHFRDPLPAQHVDLGVLSAFAGLVGHGARVADLGSGPGRVTAYLASLGLSVFGIDLSGGMVEHARREHPGLSFRQGSMFDLDLPDGELDGVLAWYSIIHTPTERLPGLFAEFARVLAPGGHLLVGFQVGDEPLRLDRPFGHDVSLDFLRRQPDEVAALLEDAGFEVRARMVRERDEQRRETARQASLLTRKR
ncbi:class I SAM-dependent methyltransferase [Streptomyces sp. NPDC026672]|uniref:class I SAM-dependent methyltransferase n=1 Tax=unclassified Streptomyces TaxID=2593676 RepID=UPI0033C7FC27